MMEHVAAFNKIGGAGLDSELNFAKDLIVKLNIDEDVVCAFLQSIFNPDNLHFLGIFTIYSDYFLVNLYDFSLP
jgi:hypothetical protein